MTALLLIAVAALAAAGYGTTLRARAALTDAASYGRHAAPLGRPTISVRAGQVRGWDTGALPITRSHP